MESSENDALKKGRAKGSSRPGNGNGKEATPTDSQSHDGREAVNQSAEVINSLAFGMEAALPGTHPKSEEGGAHLINEIDSVSAVTEWETHKVMDQLDLISQLVGRQQELITQVMHHPGAQEDGVQKSLYEIMNAGKNIQTKVFEAVNLMQFQDITRQKLERIVYHLRQIHDYIVELLGTGNKTEERPETFSHNIAKISTTPDERKTYADSVVNEFKRGMQKE